MVKLEAIPAVTFCFVCSDEKYLHTCKNILVLVHWRIENIFYFFLLIWKNRLNSVAFCSLLVKSNSGTHAETHCGASSRHEALQRLLCASGVWGILSALSCAAEDGPVLWPQALSGEYFWELAKAKGIAVGKHSSGHKELDPAMGKRCV